MKGRRIYGRRSTKLGRNGYYPKVIDEGQRQYKLIELESELDTYTDDQLIYEPVEPGFGAANRTLIIRKNRSDRTLVITISLGVIQVYWEDDYIDFGDNQITFGD